MRHSRTTIFASCGAAGVIPIRGANGSRTLRKSELDTEAILLAAVNEGHKKTGAIIAAITPVQFLNTVRLIRVAV